MEQRQAPDLLANARRMRRQPTEAEQRLWNALRDRRLGGFKFRRQHPISRYILDFYCAEAKVAVELDGGQHTEGAQADHDVERSRALSALGVRVLRFWNHEVFEHFEEVLEQIWRHLPGVSTRATGGP